MLLLGADASVSSGQVAAELGVALAESDRRVLLIASDLRGSILPRIFGMPGYAGLSELLIKGGDPAAVIQRPREASGTPLPDEVTERLTVLPSGQPTPFALSVLDSGRMRDLLGGQRGNHDFVLLDAPAATVADVLSLAAHVDGVIMLVREKKTAAKDIDALRHRLEQVGVPIVGGVLISRRRLGLGRRHVGRPRTTASQPVIGPTQPSVPVGADKPEAVVPPVIMPIQTDSDDTMVLPVPDGSVKQSQ
jgi:Mrp family chromosome partitioning ATPase